MVKGKMSKETEKDKRIFESHSCRESTEFYVEK